MPALQGMLSETSMIHLIQILTVGKRTGLLTVANDGVKGMLFLQRGQIVDAVILLTVTDEALLEGAEAFYNLLRWRDARFWFSPKTGEARGFHHTLAIGTTQLIMEGLRRLDEDREAPRPALAVDSWVRAVPGAAEAGTIEIALNELAGRILSLVGPDSRQVGDLAAASGLGQLLTLMLVAELADAGLLQVVPAPGPRLLSRRAEPALPRPEGRPAAV